MRTGFSFFLVVFLGLKNLHLLLDLLEWSVPPHALHLITGDFFDAIGLGPAKVVSEISTLSFLDLGLQQSTLQWYVSDSFSKVQQRTWTIQSHLLHLCVGRNSMCSLVQLGPSAQRPMGKLVISCSDLIKIFPFFCWMRSFREAFFFFFTSVFKNALTSPKSNKKTSTIQI